MPLPALEPVLAAITEWAQAHSLPLNEGILEVGDALPQVTVVGFDLEDVQLFLTLATGLDRPFLVVNPMELDAEGLRLIKGLADGLNDSEERRHYAGLVTAAKSHLGDLQHLTAYAFANDLSRVVVFRATTDWGEPLFSLADHLDQE